MLSFAMSSFIVLFISVLSCDCDAVMCCVELSFRFLCYYMQYCGDIVSLPLDDDDVDDATAVCCVWCLVAIAVSSYGFMLKYVFYVWCFWFCQC